MVIYVLTATLPAKTQAASSFRKAFYRGMCLFLSVYLCACACTCKQKRKLNSLWMDLYLTGMWTSKEESLKC